MIRFYILLIVSMLTLGCTKVAVVPTSKSIVLIGPPASGKGTQAQLISQELHIPVISTGELLRKKAKEGSEEGKEIREIMTKGDLVSDSIVVSLVQERLKHPDCKEGAIFDGFPRTLSQVHALKKADVKIGKVIEIQVDDDVVINRISGRRVHPASGRTYHINFNPPKTAGIDDITGEKLVARADDTIEAIKNRLLVYKRQMNPVMRWYKSQPAVSYKVVSGNDSIANVSANIARIIRRPG